MISFCLTFFRNLKKIINKSKKKMETFKSKFLQKENTIPTFKNIISDYDFLYLELGQEIKSLSHDNNSVCIEFKSEKDDLQNQEILSEKKNDIETNKHEIKNYESNIENVEKDEIESEICDEDAMDIEICNKDLKICHENVDNQENYNELDANLNEKNYDSNSTNSRDISINLQVQDNNNCQNACKMF